MKISSKDVLRAQDVADDTGLSPRSEEWLCVYNRELGIEVIEPLPAGEYIRGNDGLYLVDKWGNAWEWTREQGFNSLGSEEKVPRDGLSQAHISAKKKDLSWNSIRQSLRKSMPHLLPSEYDNMTSAVIELLTNGPVDD